MPATQWPYQTVETREFLKALGQYLYTQVDVYQVSTGRYGQLRGLPFSHVGEKPVADVFWYLTDDAKAAATADDDLAGNLVPVLYSHEELAANLLLPGLQHVVPAVKLAYMMFDNMVGEGGEVHAGLDHFGNVVVAEETCRVLSVAPDWCIYAEDGLRAGPAEYNYLRSLHFAVGLEPHQYHRRVPGFDYSTGKKPHIHN